MRYELYNLDLGDIDPRLTWARARIANYYVHLVDNYREAAKGLSQYGAHTRPSVTFARDGWAIEPARLDTERRFGGWILTGAVELEGTEEASVLFPTGTAIDDVCELLSFLSGRRVVLARDRHRYNPQPYSLPACVQNECLSALSEVWGARSLLRDRGLWVALGYYNAHLSTDEMVIKAAVLSTAVDLISQDNWAQKSRPGVETRIWKELRSQFKNLVSSQSELPAPTKNRLLGSCDQVLSDNPAALDKLDALLLDCGLVGPTYETSKEHHYSWALNRLRNDFVHRGIYPDAKRLKVGDEGIVLDCVASLVGAVLPTLVRYYLARAMGLTGLRVTEDEEHLREYFSKGSFDGQRLFDESFLDAQARLDAEWIAEWQKMS